MKLFTPEINWHNRDPIYSVDISILNEKYLRIATSGAENSVRIWALLFNESENIKIQYRSSLDRHSMSVNVVRFSPTDGLVITWKLITESIDTSETLNLENTKNLEAWNVCASGGCL
ncbi:hypothetical protein HZS_3507 [Henneguya salminicola]|nr:hypothetical protein HZS_3507 [Henneguya salminicola]